MRFVSIGMSIARAISMAAVCGGALFGCSSSRASGPCAAGGFEVQVDTDTGSLAGTLQTPQTQMVRGSCAPSSLVIVFPGSGPTDRDGNDLPRLDTNVYAQLADALQSHGIASVRYDKRGIGGSARALPADLDSFTFDDELADARRWVDEYARDARFERVVLAGHSEGALWALLLAKQAGVTGVISLEGAGRPIGSVVGAQIEQQAETAGLTTKQVDQAKDAIAALEAGTRVSIDGFPAFLSQIFDPQTQAYLMSWMKYDPAAEAAKVQVPLLIVQGTTDTQVSTTDARLLSDANADAELLEIDGMCHVLKDASSDMSAQNKAYTDPSLPLNERLVSGVVSFVERLEPH